MSGKPRRRRSERTPNPAYVPPVPQVTAPPRRRTEAPIRSDSHPSSVEFLAGYARYFDQARQFGDDPMCAAQWRTTVLAGIWA